MASQVFSKSSDAAQKIWTTYKSFWFTAVDIGFKILVFKALVLSTLFSGLVAFVFTKKYAKMFDSFITDKARRLFRGACCEQAYGDDNKVIKYKSMTNSQVLKKIDCALSHVELRIQRFKRFQSICRLPQYYEMY